MRFEPRGKPDRKVIAIDAEKPDSADAGSKVDTDADHDLETDTTGKGDEKPVPDANEDHNDSDPAPPTEQKIDSKKG